jgi:hypothetical protein
MPEYDGIRATKALLERTRAQFAENRRSGRRSHGSLFARPLFAAYRPRAHYRRHRGSRVAAS